MLGGAPPFELASDPFEAFGPTAVGAGTKPAGRMLDRTDLGIRNLIRPSKGMGLEELMLVQGMVNLLLNRGWGGGGGGEGL